MIFDLRGFVLKAAVVAAIAVPLPGIAQEPEPKPNIQPWRVVLTQQLRNEKNCNVNEVLFFNEMEIGEGVALEGRVSCIDGRMYDFSRPRVHQKFEIRLCEPAVC